MKPDVLFKKPLAGTLAISLFLLNSLAVPARADLQALANAYSSLNQQLAAVLVAAVHPPLNQQVVLTQDQINAIPGAGALFSQLQQVSIALNQANHVTNPASAGDSGWTVAVGVFQTPYYSPSYTPSTPTHSTVTQLQLCHPGQTAILSWNGVSVGSGNWGHPATEPAPQTTAQTAPVVHPSIHPHGPETREPVRPSAGSPVSVPASASTTISKPVDSAAAATPTPQPGVDRFPSESEIMSGQNKSQGGLKNGGARQTTSESFDAASPLFK